MAWSQFHTQWNFEDDQLETIYRLEKLNWLLVAHSLVCVSQSNEITFQVDNMSSCPIKLFKGTNVGIFIPRSNVMVAGTKPSKTSKSPDPIVQPQIKISRTLTSSQYACLQNLSDEFAGLFDQDRLGRTWSVAKHTILIKGPINQRMKMFQVCSREVLQQEVHKMLHQDVIWPSTSACKKKDGSWWFCIDFDVWMQRLTRTYIPLSKINNTLDSLSGMHKTGSHIKVLAGGGSWGG